MPFPCRACNTEVVQKFIDLGTTPLSNSYLKKADLNKKEPFYPLCTYVCNKCFLVQIEKFESPSKIFNDYAYFSSYSKTWQSHCQSYTKKIISRLNLNKESFVVELASNDGCLLKFFKKENIPVLGIEPAKNVAAIARKSGIETLTEFFNDTLAKRLTKKPNLIIANNVLAHVPDLKSFVKGMQIFLKENGTITVEFPHLLKLINENQFDTIYHEHFSYFSLLSVEKVFKNYNMSVFDLDEIPTHGGSLRIYVKHIQTSLNNDPRTIGENIYKVRSDEKKAGLEKISTYCNVSKRVVLTKKNLLEFLIQAKKENKKVVGYGAPAKGNTLLNYCGIHEDLLEYTVDISPHKQGLFLPGVKIPIFEPEKIKVTKPEYILILPWNIKDEIVKDLEYTKEWGCQLLTPIPELKKY